MLIIRWLIDYGYTVCYWLWLQPKCVCVAWSNGCIVRQDIARILLRYRWARIPYCLYWGSNSQCLAHPCSWYQFRDDTSCSSFQVCKSCFGCEINWSDGTMVNCWVMFWNVVSKVCRARLLARPEFFLISVAPEPMESHIHCFGLFLLYCFCDYSKCCGVVNLNWCWWLWMAHFFEQMLLGDDFPWVEV